MASSANPNQVGVTDDARLQSKDVRTEDNVVNMKTLVKYEPHSNPAFVGGVWWVDVRVS